MEKKNNVIILNKPFLGSWLDKEGNIGHEIIDFFQTDNGEHYVYNNPWGACPKEIEVKGTKDQNSNKKQYFAKYLILTGSTHKKAFDILYVIELEEKLHNHKTAREEKNIPTFRKRQEDVKEII